MFTSRVERQFEAAHHNGPEYSRCHINHGHSWKVVVEFEYEKLDKYGWGPDFAAIKQVIDRFDHQDLNALMPAPSAENVAVFLFNHFTEIFLDAQVTFVQVEEGGGNTVRYTP